MELPEGWHRTHSHDGTFWAYTRKLRWEKISNEAKIKDLLKLSALGAVGLEAVPHAMFVYAHFTPAEFNEHPEPISDYIAKLRGEDA